jgi:acyl-CoA thioester hydrolase
MPKTILIIDDDSTLVAPLKEGLESIGYRVAVAFDGVQGVIQAHQSKPDVIILDFHMPGGGGSTVYERLRKAPDTAKTPIIFSTVVTLEEVKAKITLSPNTFFLRKPVGLGQFVSVLNQVLDDNKKALPEPPPKPVETPKPGPAAEIPAKPKKAAPRFHEFSVRVTYADTDKMGIIYYANYLRYFEEGRTELMRSLGVRYRDLEIQRKLFLPAVEAHCRYLAPSRYDDLLVVRTWISELGKGSVRFENEIIDQDLGGRRVARGYSRHALVNDLWRPARVPDDLRKLLEPYIGERPEA